MRPERLAFAIGITPSLHALEEILRPTQAKMFPFEYGPNPFN
jgi:hypothetical protein